MLSRKWIFSSLILESEEDEGKDQQHTKSVYNNKKLKFIATMNKFYQKTYKKKDDIYRV